jgi:transposase
MGKFIKNSINVHQKKISPAVSLGKPIYTANLTVGVSTIKVEILNPSSSYPELEFKQTPEDTASILSLFTVENIKGVRLAGKKSYCHLLAETFLKQGIRPLISNSTKSGDRGIKGIPVIDESVAGIDIGKSVIYVAIPSHLDEDHTRVFGTFSDELQDIINWLKEHNIQKVAMESTSVYWIPLYELCEKNNIKPILVNPKYVKTLPGRKTDVLDSQWLMKLLACGLLQGGFIPPLQIREMRDLARSRQDMMGRAADSLNIVHKMLAQMNLHLSNVLSDISGKSGMAIVRAIAAGERNPHKLAALSDDRCRCSKEDIAKALTGTYNEAHIFIMKQELDTYEYLHKKIVETELKIKELLERLPDKPNLPPLPVKRQKQKKEYNRSPYCFDMRSLLYKKFGYDLTILSGIEDSTAAIIIFETGGNMDAFPTSKHFASWNGTAPGNKVSGGKVLSGKAPKKFSRVGQALRIASNANYKADSAAGAYLRRLVHKGKSKKSARKASAHKIGTQVYNIMKFGQNFVEKGAAEYEKRYEERKVKAMTKFLKEKGYDVIKKVA